MGCGQTSRVDACHHAIDKARKFGFDVSGSVMASDAFSHFPIVWPLPMKQASMLLVQPGIYQRSG